MTHKRIVRTLLLAATALLVGCQDGINHFGQNPSSSAGGSPSAPPASVGKGDYSILLAHFMGPDHVAQAEENRKKAAHYTGWDNLFVINQDNFSGLYWDRYETRQQAVSNLATAKSYRTPAGYAIFQKAIIVPLGDGQDVGPAEWNLKNAPGEYSVLVAVFADLPEQNYMGRKKRAVQLAEKLRQQGKEAWYFHGPQRSGVTLGTFPAGAVRTVQARKQHPQTGDVFFVEQKVVTDPRMKALLAEYPELLYCGNTVIRTVIDPATGRPKKYTQETYAVSIPEITKDAASAYSPGQP
jgi:hypothetical protein